MGSIPNHPLVFLRPAFRASASRRPDGLFWVELKNLEFAAGSPVRKLSLTENSQLLVDGKFVAGEVTRHFRTASPFAFAGVKN